MLVPDGFFLRCYIEHAACSEIKCRYNRSTCDTCSAILNWRSATVLARLPKSSARAAPEYLCFCWNSLKFVAPFFLSNKHYMPN